MSFNPIDLQIKLFADGADIDGMIEMSQKPYIKGLTTNPTLLRKAGIKNYQDFALEVLKHIKNKPISFEVCSDEFTKMYNEALRITDWAENVYVKIPITNTRGESTHTVIDKLVRSGCKVNITAIMTEGQVKTIANYLDPTVPSYISIFAGRIADTGKDPGMIIEKSIKLIKQLEKTELIWASPRELLNIFQAESLGCHIITATSDLLNKLPLVGKNLEEYSLETVRMFYDDSLASGFNL